MLSIAFPVPRILKTVTRVAVALADLASVEASAVPPDLVKRLAKDHDALVASKAREVGRRTKGAAPGRIREAVRPVQYLINVGRHVVELS